MLTIQMSRSAVRMTSRLVMAFFGELSPSVRRLGGGTALCLVALPWLAISGCGGGSSGTPKGPTPHCVRASDCSGLLVCVQGFCVQQCAESKDCTTGERCIKATEGYSCQPPEKTLCAYTSDCTVPLVCGIDQQCRSQCQNSVDCPPKQVCTSVTKLCADPTVDKNYDPVTNELKASVDAGAPDGPSTGGVDAPIAPDVNPGILDTPVAIVEAGKPDVAVAVDTASADKPLTNDVAPAGIEVALNFDAPALAVDGVVVTPDPSVRQGQINVTITITRASGGLASAGLFDMGDLTVRPQTGGSDVALVLKVSVPHGAVLGKRTLKFATSTGVVTATNLLEVTPITSGPTGLDSNAGSAGSPFLTLKQALLVADTGDTIHLMDGTYNAKGGETWGYVIPDNLTIVGDSTAGTIIDGAGATTNPNGFNASTALTLKTLTLEHFYYGIDMQKPASTLSLQDVILAGNSSNAIYVEQAATGSTVNITGKNGLIDQPGQSAVSVYNAPSVTVNVTDATLQGGTYVIYFAYNCSGSKLNLSGATVKELANYSAIYLALSSNTTGITATIDKSTIVGDIYVSDTKANLTITGSTLTQKYSNEIDFYGLALNISNSPITMTAANTAIYFAGAQGTMTLTNVSITGGGYGIQQLGTGSSAKVRGTTIQGTSYDAYYLTAGDLDLGTGAESGDNTVAAPASTSYYCLNVYRPQGASSGNPVTCSGTTLNGLAPTPGTIDASAGTITLQPQRYSVSTGNKLIFY